MDNALYKSAKICHSLLFSGPHVIGINVTRNFLIRNEKLSKKKDTLSSVFEIKEMKFKAKIGPWCYSNTLIISR